MANEKPQIELYMYSLNQEFPVGTHHGKFQTQAKDQLTTSDGRKLEIDTKITKSIKTLKDRPLPTGGPDGGWTSDYVIWAAKLELYRQGEENIRTIEASLNRLIIREEEFGGILFDPVTDRVYKVNKAGYKLVQEMLKAGKKPTRTFTSKNFDTESVAEFTTFLKGAGLWES